MCGGFAALVASVFLVATNTLPSSAKSVAMALDPGAIRVSALNISPSSLVGGSTSVGTVTLNSPAPSGGQTVLFAIDPYDTNNSPISIPATIIIKTGARSSTFTIQTKTVDSAKTVNVVAWISGADMYRKATPITILPPPGVALLSISPASVTSSIGKGVGSIGTISLRSPAPKNGLSVSISATPGNAVTLPGNVVFKSGEINKSFNIQARPATEQIAVTITARSGSSEKSAVLNIAPPLTVSAFTITPPSVMNGTPATGKVTLNGPAPKGGQTVLITIESRTYPNPKDMSIPVRFTAGLTVKAGETAGTFVISTLPVSANTNVTFAAVLPEERANGQFNQRKKTAVLTIATIARTVSSITLSPDSLFSGKSSVGTVTLSGPAPTGGQIVYLSTSWDSTFVPLSSIPASFVIIAGKTSGTFTVKTRASMPAVPSHVTITATANGTQKSAVLSINDVTETLTISEDELMKSKTPYDCTFNFKYPEQGVSETGELWTDGKGERMRIQGDITFDTDPSSKIRTYAIMDKYFLYSWGDSGSDGMKFSMSDMTNPNATDAEKQQAAELSKKQVYTCRRWTVDASKFALPANIQFKDYVPYVAPK